VPTPQLATMCRRRWSFDFVQIFLSQEWQTKLHLGRLIPDGSSLRSVVLDVSRPESISTTQVHGYCGRPPRDPRLFDGEWRPPPSYPRWCPPGARWVPPPAPPFRAGDVALLSSDAHGSLSLCFCARYFAVQVVVLLAYLGYLAAAGAILPGKLVAGAVLPDSSRLHYRCNGTTPTATRRRSSQLHCLMFISSAARLFCDPQVCTRSCCCWVSLRSVSTWTGCLQR
jgi:hypothetical protein